MKGCKAIQIIFGIICALVTIVLGSVTVLLFLPYIGGDLTDGIFHTLYEGIQNIATTIGLEGYTWAILCAVFALPTVLLVFSTNLLLYGKRGGSIVAGSVLALLALIIVGGATGYFSKELFGDLQKWYLIGLGCLSALFLLMFILTTSAVKRATKKAKASVAVDGDIDTGDEIIITVEEDVDQDVDTADTSVVEPTTDEGAVDQPADQPTDDGILFMAQDYSSVSEVADETYEHNDVIPKKVLEKLKIARELYEKGAITKDEYLSIVNKYLSQQ